MFKFLSELLLELNAKFYWLSLIILLVIPKSSSVIIIACLYVFLIHFGWYLAILYEFDYRNFHKGLITFLMLVSIIIFDGFMLYGTEQLHKDFFMISILIGFAGFGFLYFLLWLSASALNKARRSYLKQKRRSGDFTTMFALYCLPFSIFIYPSIIQKILDIKYNRKEVQSDVNISPEYVINKQQISQTSTMQYGPKRR